MTISELGSLGEFIGSIVVLFTLIYLIFQVRQNTISIRSQSRFHVLEALNRDMKLNLDPNFLRVSSNIGADGKSATDARMLSWYWLSMLSHLEMLHYEIADGALPKSFNATLKFRVATLFLFADSKLYWEANRHLYTPEFQAYVDAQIPKIDETLATPNIDTSNRHDWIARALQSRGSIELEDQARS